jgi:hypothetical protein
VYGGVVGSRFPSLLPSASLHSCVLSYESMLVVVGCMGFYGSGFLRPTSLCSQQGALCCVSRRVMMGIRWWGGAGASPLVVWSVCCACCVSLGGSAMGCWSAVYCV